VKSQKKKIILQLSTFLLAILTILIAIPWYALTLFLNQRYDQYQHNPDHFNINAETITLTTNDELNLAAWHVQAESDQPHGTVIILSGIQQPSVTAFFGYAQMFAEAGWDSLLIEKRARSLSEGDSIGLAMTEWLDVEAGVLYLEADERVNDLPIIVMGTSAGGSTAIVAAGELPRIDGVIAISAYTSFIDAYVDNVRLMGLPRFIGEATRPFMRLHLNWRFGTDDLNQTPLNALTAFDGRPLLLMHATQDWQVPFSHFEQLELVATEIGIPLTTFVREGDWHFVVYDRYLFTPTQDVLFSDALFAFLAQFE